MQPIVRIDRGRAAFRVPYDGTIQEVVGCLKDLLIFSSSNCDEPGVLKCGFEHTLDLIAQVGAFPLGSRFPVMIVEPLYMCTTHTYIYIVLVLTTAPPLKSAVLYSISIDIDVAPNT